MKNGTHKLSGARDCCEGLSAGSIGDAVTVDRSGSLLRFVDRAGRALGTLTARHELAKRLEAGETVLHCSINSVYGPCDMRPDGAVHVRVVTGAADEVYVPWTGPEPSGPRAYAVNIVGEASYQDAIQRCRPGDVVTLFRESNNPHDPRAIVVKTLDGATIGYIPRTGWFQRVVHEEGSGATAAIKVIHSGPPAAVILDVVVTGDPIGEVAYRQPLAARPAETNPGEEPTPEKG